MTASEGSGAGDGIVIPLQLISSGTYDAAYTLPVRVGGSKTFSLQVDTGSSDLWLASTSCSTSACSSIGAGNLYNPSGSSTQTGVTFNISYLRGQVSGPIVWDHVDIGGYSIDNQALAAANVVNSEPLSSSFSGILGLALPLNSIIAQQIPPVTDNSPDGAAWASNLFSITPTSSAPSSRFLSLSLSRPGSDRVPSLLGIGHHPSALVPDPSRVLYSSLVSDRLGTLYWKLSVRAITVYVGGVPKPIAIGRSNTGGVFPTAVLDSGIPLILTTSKVANAIYGALGIGPASDGNYYVPCTMPLNMTVTLDDRPEIPLHPLDLTAEPQDNNQAQYCVGLIQVADNWLSTASAGIGDMILGVPFLRNTYTVMAYTAPYANGSFPDPSLINSTNIQPMLGLLPLTDPKIALDEFHTVRLLNQPISSSNHPKSPPSSSGDNGGKKISVGIIVLLGLVGFFSLCCALFGLRWFLLKRRFRKGAVVPESDGGHGGGPADAKTVLGDSSLSDLEKKPTLPYAPLAASSFEDVGLGAAADPSAPGGGGGDPDTTLVARPRGLPFPKERIDSAYTVSSGKTHVGDDGYGGYCGWYASKEDVPGSAITPTTATTLAWRGTWSQDDVPPVMHDRNRSVSAPLLSHQHHHSRSFDSDDNNGGGGGGSPARRNGRGVRRRRSTLVEGDEGGDVTVVVVQDSEPNLAEFGYRPSTAPSRLPRRGEEEGEDGEEDGILRSSGSMAGIGSAARRVARFESLPFPRESFVSPPPAPPPLAVASEPEPQPISLPPPPPPPPVRPLPPPPPPPSHSAAVPVRYKPPSLLGDFDPYLGYPDR